MNKEEDKGNSFENNSQDNNQDYVYLLQQDYYEKFKLGQNLYEQSATLSRISLGEKTSEDNNNTFSYINMMNMKERLSDQILKNQVLENKIEQLSKEITGALNHVKLLQKQNELQSELLKDANVKLQQKNKAIEIEKTINRQLKRQIQELQKLNTNYAEQMDTMSLKKESVILSNYKNSGLFKNSNQSNSSSQRKFYSNKIHQGLTEDSTFKDSSCSEQKSQDFIRYSESAQKFYKSSNLLSPAQQISPQLKNNDIESRIDSTLAQIRAIKLQIQQIKKK
ncbi:unnamed protein product [Paramecium sonneborni]|uniref:Uncharacterized protein n=1 Tax=Paramecium sonneborni TaxID=65129 RepID=A0A8S1Q6Y2_9CILI|nr:unnamed protein product [Paramecium sonneborni]